MLKLPCKSMHFGTIDSTSAFIKRRRRFLKDMTFVRADSQTAGRGRQGRVWESRKGENLLFSVYICDSRAVERFGLLSSAAAVSVLRSLEELGVRDLSVKWPNDVYAGGKKICGILLEGFNDISEDSKALRMTGICLGIGINVNQKEFPDGLLRAPTSVALETGKLYPLSDISETVYKDLKAEIEKIKNGDFSFYDILTEKDYLKGKTVLAEINGEKKTVNVFGINPDCTLKVSADGTVRNLNSGEITFHI